MVSWVQTAEDGVEDEDEAKVENGRPTLSHQPPIHKILNPFSRYATPVVDAILVAALLTNDSIRFNFHLLESRSILVLNCFFSPRSSFNETSRLTPVTGRRKRGCEAVMTRTQTGAGGPDIQEQMTLIFSKKTRQQR